MAKRIRINALLRTCSLTASDVSELYNVPVRPSSKMYILENNEVIVDKKDTLNLKDMNAYELLELRLKINDAIYTELEMIKKEIS